jgi:Tol biopolymer transport system component
MSAKPLPAIIVTAAGALLSTLCHPAAASPLLTLHEGSNISISLAGPGRLTFDLVGGIWIMDPRDGQAEPVTDITEYNRHPAFSPDGERIAYESVRDGFHQIMLIGADGGPPEQLTFGEYHHLSPAWAPDGRRLVIASDRAGTFDLWELDIGTLTLSQLTAGPLNDREPAWDAEGRTLAFVRDEGTESSIMALRPGARPNTLVTEQARIHGPSWRPGNGVLTYVRELGGTN